MNVKILTILYSRASVGRTPVDVWFQIAMTQTATVITVIWGATEITETLIRENRRLE
jgi:hypothetical protein